MCMFVVYIVNYARFQSLLKLNYTLNFTFEYVHYLHVHTYVLCMEYK